MDGGATGEAACGPEPVPSGAVGAEFPGPPSAAPPEPASPAPPEPAPPGPPSTTPTSRAAAATTSPAGAPKSSGALRLATTVPARSTRTTVSSSRSRCSPTACPASGTSRSTVRGLPPVEARWPASAARPSARSRAVILLTACGVSPVRSASSSRLIPRSPATRSRSSTSAALWLRSVGRFAPVLLMFTAPLSPSLALWQQRCLSGLHDWHHDTRDARLPLRVGLVGYGLAGSVFHAPLIAATEGLTLDTVVTSNEERRAQARAEFPDVRFAASPDELWARADELDLIVIASPNKTHVPIATAALEAGLPVVVDKPISRHGRRGARGSPRWRRSAGCCCPSSRTAAGTTIS